MKKDWKYFDESIELSLLNYHIIIKEENDDEYEIIFLIGDNYYITNFSNKKIFDIINYRNGLILEKDVEWFLDGVRVNKDHSYWNQDNYFEQIYDLRYEFGLKIFNIDWDDPKTYNEIMNYIKN